MDVATVVALIGALGIGSIVGQYVAGAGQRRQTRAEVLRALGRVESARWAGPDEPEVPFRQAIRELETAALLARLPRDLIVHYKVLAQAGHWLSTESWDEYPDPEFGGGIEGHFADVIWDAAADVSQLAWRPWLGRVRIHRRIRERDSRAKEIDDAKVQRELKRSQDRPLA